LDAIAKANMYTVTTKGSLRTFPHRHLTSTFKEAVKTLPFEDIESKIGVFYAIKLNLGGCVQKTYIMEATESDSKTTVTAELEAKYGAGCWGVAGESKNEMEFKTSSKSAKMRTEWRAQGGKTEMWLGIDFANSSKSAKTVAEKWAGTLTPANVYPCDFELKPMWELVKAVDHERGVEFQKYLEEKWARDVSKYNPTRFLKSNPMICKHKSAKKIIEECKKHKDWSRDQSSKAQGWINTWTAQFDLTRNRNWRSAANSGAEEMDTIIGLVRDVKLTVEDFREKMEDRRKQRELNSKHYWGMGGHDSVESNRVEAGHASLMQRVIGML